MDASGASLLNRDDLRDTMNVNLAPKSGILPTQSTTNGENGYRLIAQAPIVSQHVVSAGPEAQMSGLQQAGGDSTIEVGTHAGVTNPEAVAPTAGGQSSGRYSRQYLLPDGSIAPTGKGLGRGRPGIKRGPRNSRSADGDSPAPSSNTGANSPPSLPLTPTAAKRKRTDSILSNTQIPSRGSRDSTPEYNPNASSQTRSGRQTQRPASIIVPSPTVESPATKKSTATPTTATPMFKSHPKIKRRVYKGKEQFALCERCLRSFGPPTNVIVFCDACNKCWHQRCHEPQISKEVVADTKAEWFCTTCDKILHGTKKSKKIATPAPKPVESVVPPLLPPPPPPSAPKYGMPLVEAGSLTPMEQRTYLATLTKEQLINVALRASYLDPKLLIYESRLRTPPPMPPVQQQPMPQFASNYVTPVDQVIGLDRPGQNDALADEGYDDHFDEHAALYPKAGEGVQLPPDRVDLHMLLEGPDSRTFSHWVRASGLPMKTMMDTVSLR